MAMSQKDFLSIANHSKEEILEVLNLASEQKTALKDGPLPRSHEGRTLACIFHKPSLRTRISFEVAIMQLGGNSLYITDREIGIGTREAPQDVARVLERYVDAIMIRTFDQQMVEDLAKFANVPVINGLTDLLHPCQILADLQTIQEHRGNLDDLTVTFVGDGNNVARSWLNAAVKLGFRFVLSCPPGYEIEREFVEPTVGSQTDLYDVIHDAAEAVKGANVIYTDAWASMGQEAEADKRRQDFAGFQVNDALMAQAPDDAIVLHCLPAHRGEEITGDMMESPRTLIFDEAENRMHAQRALLSLLVPPTGARG